jgi:hypothetical protein
MHVYFGVKFSTEVIIEADLNDENTVKNMTPEITKIYVAPESEHIFEPKKGDIGCSPSKDYGGALIPVTVQSYHKRTNSTEVYFPGREFYDDDFKIIMRDKKQFFMAEVENER